MMLDYKSYSNNHTDVLSEANSAGDLSQSASFRLRLVSSTVTCGEAAAWVISLSGQR